MVKPVAALHEIRACFYKLLVIAEVVASLELFHTTA